ncbi:MAG: pseudouridine synthase [Patescibacteria group bacterium]
MNQEYPMRINKYLAKKNVCSRREADQFIAEGKVFLSGKKARLGDKVQENDEVEFSEVSKKNVYLAFWKPRGIATHSSERQEKDIQDIFKYKTKVYPVGRLDKDSEGLIILTNDGRITDPLLNPESFHEKEYIVEVDREISPSFLLHMSEGVELPDGYKTRKCQVEKIGRTTFSIILTEGKKRQIRRMCEKLERRVLSLKRVRVMNVLLGELKPGQARELKGEEKEKFLENIFKQA